MDGKYKFEQDDEMRSFVSEMATTGTIPKRWSAFVAKIDELYAKKAVVCHGRILMYIKQKGYDWTVYDILREYDVFCNGGYVSHTAKDVILNCIDTDSLRVIDNENYISEIMNLLVQDPAASNNHLKYDKTESYLRELIEKDGSVLGGLLAAIETYLEK